MGVCLGGIGWMPLVRPIFSFLLVTHIQPNLNYILISLESLAGWVDVPLVTA